MFEKAFEEYKKLPKWKGKIFMKDEETCYKDGAEFGYNKANEWHFVKDGDLPPEDTKVLALMAEKEICIAHFYRRNVWDKIGIVIAWCEIPKYTEE